METLAQSKFFIALGGFLGFALTFASGMLAGGDTADVLRDASIGCLICAILMKLLMSVIRSNVQAAMQRRMMERDEEAEFSDDEDELMDDDDEEI